MSLIELMNGTPLPFNRTKGQHIGWNPAAILTRFRHALDRETEIAAPKPEAEVIYLRDIAP